MTGYESKRAAAQDKLAQPAQEFNRTWVCNECGSQQFTSAICEADLDYLACSNCGGNEFHKEALVQPAQEPVANDRALQLVTHQLNHWVAYATELRERLNKYEGGAPMLLNTTPPQRTWVDLTNDEINNLAAGCHLGNSVQDAIYKALAKLKDKNNG